jgi:hypothetical protein
VRTWRFITLLLVALTLGLSFAHTLEMPAKLEYDGPLYVTVQQTLYRWWGPPLVGAFLEPSAVLATAVLAFLVRRRRRTFAVTLAATVLLLVAFPVVFLLAVEPANAAFRQATPQAPPTGRACGPSGSMGTPPASSSTWPRSRCSCGLRSRPTRRRSSRSGRQRVDPGTRWKGTNRTKGYFVPPLTRRRCLIDADLAAGGPARRSSGRGRASSCRSRAGTGRPPLRRVS